MNNEEHSNSVKSLPEQLDLGFALEVTQLGVWELNLRSKYVLWDDRCRALFGLSSGNSLSYEQALSYIHPDDVERVRTAVQRATDPAVNGSYDETYRTIGADDGKLRWVRFYGRAYSSEEGDVYRFAGVAHEVTDQKMAEQREDAVRDHAARQQRILETISSTTPDLMYVFDLNYRFTYANQALLNMWGATWEDSIGKSLLEIGYEPWHAEMHEREIDQVVATRKSIRGEVSFVHASLGRRIYDYVFSPVVNENGEVEAIAGTTRDVTDLIVARQALEENQAALSTAIEVAELGTWAVDIAHKTCTLSQRVADWLGLDTTTIDLESFLARIGESDRERIRKSFSESGHLRAGTHYDETYMVDHATDGRHRIIHAMGRVYFDKEGRAVKLEGSAQDITTERLMTQLLEQQVQQRTLELERVNESLLRSNDNLRNFAYVASHDLQEPLRKIQQFGNLLISRQTTFSDNELSYVKRMHSAAGRMSVLIDDLLNFASVSMQQPANEPVDTNQVVENVLSTLEVAIVEANADIRVEPLPEISGSVSQLTQLFQNLIGNAIKFRKSSVRPEIRITAQTVDAGQLPAAVSPVESAVYYHRIDVIDNGIGFDEKYRDRIFQVFHRLHGKSEFAGTGIGLAICERVAANHGGAITASSIPDKGSTFSIFLRVR